MFIAVLALWSILAFLFIFVFAGGHVCTMLSPVAADATPIPQVETAAQTAAICNRPDIGAITVFGFGYIVMGAIAVRSIRDRKDAGLP